jgi:hypothetical protein
VTPDPMLTENFILIENVTETDIVTVLSNLANLYADTGFTDGIELSQYNNFNNRFLVTFRNTPDLERFAYFVNYIYYPKGFEVFQPLVKGFYQIKHIEAGTDFKPGDWLQIYVSKNDTAFDNVSIVNAANESFLFDFGGKTTKNSFTEEKYHLSTIGRSECSLLKLISPVSKALEETSKPWWKFW